MASTAAMLPCQEPLRELLEPTTMYPYSSAAAWYRSTGMRPRAAGSNARITGHTRSGEYADGR